MLPKIGKDLAKSTNFNSEFQIEFGDFNDRTNLRIRFSNMAEEVGKKILWIYNFGRLYRGISIWISQHSSFTTFANTLPQKHTRHIHTLWFQHIWQFSIKNDFPGFRFPTTTLYILYLIRIEHEISLKFPPERFGGKSKLQVSLSVAQPHSDRCWLLINKFQSRKTDE